MASQQWIFKYGAGSTVFTTDVLSFSGRCGRQNPMDNYAGGYFNITIKNNSNQVANFPRGTKVTIYLTGSVFAWSGKVSQIDYFDYPGNTGLSTATITCLDSISQAGKYVLKQFAYAIDYSILQASQPNALVYPNGPQIIGTVIGDSYCSGTTPIYNSTLLNRVNALCNTERGLLFAGETNVNFYARSQITNLNGISLVRDTGSNSRLTYTNFRRIAQGDNFMNQVSVESDYTNADAGNTTIQQYTNTDSQTTYGTSGYVVSALNYFAVDALNQAAWLANTQGDPTTFRFEVDFSDVSSNATAFQSFLSNYLNSQKPLTILEWKAQGQSTELDYVIIEGLSFSGTPDRTDVTVYLSPFEYYNCFVLNSSTNGQLAYNRLGWATA